MIKGGLNMGSIVRIISGMGILIAIYLFVANARGTASIISSVGSNSVNMVKTLQGR